MLNNEELVAVQRLAGSPGDTLDKYGLPDTPEVQAALTHARAFLDGLGDAVADIPGEFPDAGSVDHLYDRSAAQMAALFDKDGNLVDAEAKVTKSVGEHRFTLGPMYVPDRIDAHEEWTDSGELQKAVWGYVDSGDRDIRLQHNRDVVAGHWSEIVTWPYEVTVPMLKADGTSTEMTFPKDTVFLGVHWEDWAWDLVKAGKLRGYSVGGRAKRILVDLEGA